MTTPYSYWRINATSAGGPMELQGWPDQIQYAAIVMKAAPGGQDQCIYPGSAIGVGSSLSFAFDHVYADFSTGNPGVATIHPTEGDWIGFHFAFPVVVAEYEIHIYANKNNYAPKDWTLEACNDGVSWQVIATEHVEDWMTPWPENGFAIRTFTGQAQADAPVSGHAHWRLYVQDNCGGFRVNIGALELRATVGGADQCIGGAPWSSHTYSEADNIPGDDRHKAFDGISGEWISDGGVPCYLQYNFPSAVQVAEYRIVNGSYASRAPSSWELQWSDDTVTWTTADSVSGQYSWAAGETRTFLNDGRNTDSMALREYVCCEHWPHTLSAQHSYWRMKILEGKSGSVLLSRLEFRDVAGGSSLCSDGTPIESGHSYSNFAANAFDSDNSTDWGSGSFPAYIGYHFASPVEVVEYAFRLSDNFTSDPVKWLLEYSDDGANWYPAFPYEGQRWYPNGPVQDFTSYYWSRGWHVCNIETPQDGSHGFWRLDIDGLNNSDPYVRIESLELLDQWGNNLCLAGGAGTATDSSAGFDYVPDMFAGGAQGGWDVYLPHPIAQFHFTTSSRVVSYRVKASRVNAPKDWTLLYSNDGIAWTVCGRETSQTSWGLHEVRTFEVSDPLGSNVFNRLMAESLDLGDRISLVSYFLDLFEALTIRDSLGKSALGVVAKDSVSLNTRLVGNVGKQVRDYIQFSHILTAAGTRNINLAEKVLAFDQRVSAAKIFLQTVSEALTAGVDTPLYLYAKGVFLREVLQLPQTLETRQIGTRAITDQFKGVDAATALKVFKQAIQEALDAGDALTANALYTILIAEISGLSADLKMGLGAKLIEHLENADAAGANWKGVKSLLDAVTLDTFVGVPGLGMLLQEIITTSDDPAYLFALVCLASDLVSTADAGTTGLMVSARCNSSLTLSTEIITTASLNGILEDHVRLSFTVKLDGELYQCWCFTTDGMFPSLYTNFKFNSFATLPDGKVFGCKEDGIYLLEGEDDAGVKIETDVRLNYFNFGTHRLKSLYYAAFGLVGDTPVLKVITAEGEHKYYVRHGYAKLPQGVKSQTWELELADIDALDFVEITPIILSALAR